MRPLLAIAVAVLAGFIISPLVRAEADCTPASAPTGWSDEQIANARLIVTVGHQRRVPDEALVIAVATAMQESSLRNLKGGDRDSIGLFQQRPSQGWGTPRQLSDPEYQTGKFYDKLLRIEGWQEMRVTEAAQAVQVSAFPEAYAKRVPAATDLIVHLNGPAPCPGTPPA